MAGGMKKSEQRARKQAAAAGSARERVYVPLEDEAEVQGAREEGFVERERGEREKGTQKPVESPCMREVFGQVDCWSVR